MPIFWNKINIRKIFGVIFKILHRFIRIFTILFYLLIILIVFSINFAVVFGSENIYIGRNIFIIWMFIVSICFILKKILLRIKINSVINEYNEWYAHEDFDSFVDMKIKTGQL
jgi:hypothetical protein